MDRFQLKISLAYPNDAEELDIIRLVRAEEQGKQVQAPKISEAAVLSARSEVSKIHVSAAIEDYMVALVMATRHGDRYADSPLDAWIMLGASPRATIALDRTARAHAWLQGREMVMPEDVQAVFPWVICHRIMLSYSALAKAVSAEQVAAEIVRSVAVA